ncbi:hypothetical protein [Paenibacillus sp. Soil724D2]|uniref:hypothetical protein n=1 Tax=Paenibacillus sp. (strain Soil724D2) TaxID=1736392 RepID=UPI0007132E77|nr:hypothetical protein [Paenibacillus sp. Soil724D2]KRE33440.1 hypothetical protein ASG85_14330 [Paenibacillus sp. Soil724D2]
MNINPLKQGDTLVLTVNLDTSVQASELKSQVRSSTGILLGDFVIEPTSNEGQFTFTILDTEEWDIGNAFMDIRRTFGGVVATSDTITIPVTKGVTQ